MDGIESIQASGSNEVIISTSGNATTSDSIEHIDQTDPRTIPTSSSEPIILSSHNIPSNISEVGHDIPSRSNIPKQQTIILPRPKRKSDSVFSISTEESSSSTKAQVMSTFCTEKNKLKRLEVDLARERLRLDHEKWEYEKQLIEQSIMEKKYEGMYYYLKCREIIRSSDLPLDEINTAYELFNAKVEMYEVQEDDQSFNESVTSSNNDEEYIPPNSSDF